MTIGWVDGPATSLVLLVAPRWDVPCLYGANAGTNKIPPIYSPAGVLVVAGGEGRSVRKVE